MNNRFVISILLFLFSLIAKGQTINRVVVLLDQVQRLQQTDSLILEFLPDSFEEYYELCGDIDSPLYNCDDLIEHLSYSTTIDKTLFLKKIVSLCIGGKYSADHISSLHDVAVKELRKDCRSVIVILNSLSETDNLLYWRFLFGGIETRDLDYYEAIKRIRQVRGMEYRFPASIKAGYDSSIVLSH